MSEGELYVDFLACLPDELTVPVLSYLRIGGLGSCSGVSHTWNDVIRESPVWKDICRRQGYLTGVHHQPPGGAYYRCLCRHLMGRLRHLQDNVDVMTFGDVLTGDHVTTFHQSGRRVVSGDD